MTTIAKLPDKPIKKIIKKTPEQIAERKRIIIGVILVVVALAVVGGLIYYASMPPKMTPELKKIVDANKFVLKNIDEMLAVNPTHKTLTKIRPLFAKKIYVAHPQEKAQVDALYLMFLDNPQLPVA